MDYFSDLSEKEFFESYNHHIKNKTQLFRERFSHETTSDEKKMINEYRKVLTGTLPSIGLDI